MPNWPSADLSAAPAASKKAKADVSTATKIWQYDIQFARNGQPSGRATARLQHLSLICLLCHAVEHIGRIESLIAAGTLPTSHRDVLIAHFCRVNRVGPRSWQHHYRAAFKRFFELSQLDWWVDWGRFPRPKCPSWAEYFPLPPQWPDNLMIRADRCASLPTRGH
jgi:hypothetical protein